MVHKLYSVPLLFGNGYQKMLECFYRRVRFIDSSVSYIVEGLLYSYDIYPYTVMFSMYYNKLLIHEKLITIKPLTFIPFSFLMLKPFSIRYITFKAKILTH